MSFAMRRAKMPAVPGKWKEMLEKENEKEEAATAAMRKRREAMADGRRYIIYYDFEKESDAVARSDESGRDEKGPDNSVTGAPDS